ncbi:Helix-turn-helix domain-containing protein [Paenibacillus algorifonticola]|uniref:Helix-turn-helix domain-containing protein n=1 Tax=Paenibacillus algorifonticola TaxID=684063 RepID=A0A1I2EVM4_9BACL|nr:helix-turn-helix domain-containing protein [Paenibacillus algorifonticola]SFE97144.1 Helix-turn-helix domain-containing protein [Paenibacillus algorifonticola]
MSKKNEYNAIEKLAIIQELKAGQSSRVEVAKKHNISVTTLVKWRHRYELYGIEGLEIHSHTRSYSAELKLQAA